MQKVTVYGFGSFFSNQKVAKDIDILILHDEISYVSARFASLVKKFCKSAIPFSDIVMLSKKEEQDMSFIKMSKATYIGDISSNSIEDDVGNLLYVLISKTCSNS